MGAGRNVTTGNTQRTTQGITHITVRGARQHNLRNVVGVDSAEHADGGDGAFGSGKSSLAFDTIYAEGQRRYVETLSAYARQFLDQMERPDVDAIDGLSPAISIEQKTTSRSAAVDGGDDYGDLRLSAAAVCVGRAAALPELRAADYAADGGADCGADRRTQAPGERITVYAPMVRGRKGEFREELEALDQQGFRARIDGEITELTEGMRLDKRKNHTVEAIVDRIILKPLVVAGEREASEG